MEDLMEILNSVMEYQLNLDTLYKTQLNELSDLLNGATPNSGENAKATSQAAAPAISGSSSVTPQQAKKRPKRLTSLSENEHESETDPPSEYSVRQSARMSNSQLLAVAEAEENLNSTASLMPPPPAPTLADSTMNSGRPQRAAKLKSEKNLKEPSLMRKMRRPSEEELVKVKVESEQRPSQFNSSTSSRNKTTTIEKEAIIPDPAPVTDISVGTTTASVDTSTADKSSVESESSNRTRNLRVEVKREKLSIDMQKATGNSTVALEAETTRQTDDTVLSKTTGEPTKKTKKKAANHRPIKVERFSILDQGSPISSRTRKNSTETRPRADTQNRSIYKDALEAPSNETVVLGPAPTSTVPPADATVVISGQPEANDATFQVNSGEQEDSMETARDVSLPEAPRHDSLMTEDNSVEEPLPVAAVTKLTSSASTLKALKMPTRPHELFNPLMQSPVKMRVEAFEQVAIAQNNLRPKRIKDINTPGSSNTPKVGKLPAPTVGRFFTPTQSSSVVPINSAQPKKAPMSASKAGTLTKTATGTNLKTTNSTSTKTLSRENSGDDFRKGLHQLAEERKKQREQKHLQAAQQREAKERERAERMAKLAKEREEKRIKKQQEKEKLEEKRRQEMEEQQRKMRLLEEAESAKKAKLRELEQQKLQQLNAKAKQMLPPPPKNKFTWEMLHEDDSTDDEEKVTYKRPPAPLWSRSHIRGEAIKMQSHAPTDVIDSFFSVAPTTPDLKLIFPNIDPSHLKRNSSVLWSTPPRYSELPKY
ncbi:inner centromere protein [Drosophila tropicalis]|uniref:inner centromere protein n=1 Tax=Drosophila tropicalis TaxID=46794 RepID=UPI0035AB75E7